MVTILDHKMTVFDSFLSATLTILSVILIHHPLTSSHHWLCAALKKSEAIEFIRSTVLSHL